MGATDAGYLRAGRGLMEAMTEQWKFRLDRWQRKQSRNASILKQITGPGNAPGGASAEGPA